jgi:hypothetical protein
MTTTTTRATRTTTTTTTTMTVSAATNELSESLMVEVMPQVQLPQIANGFLSLKKKKSVKA